MEDDAERWRSVRDTERAFRKRLPVVLFRQVDAVLLQDVGEQRENLRLG